MALGTKEKYWGGSVVTDEDGRLVIISEGEEVGPLAATEKYWGGSHATDEYGRLVVVGPGGAAAGGATIVEVKPTTLASGSTVFYKNPETGKVEIEYVGNSEGKAVIVAEFTGIPADGSVTAAKLAANAVTAAALAAEAVEAAKLALGAVTAAALAAEAVESSKIKGEAVTSGKIGVGAVTAAKLAVEAVEAAKIKAEAIESTKIKEEAVTEGKLSSAVKNKLLTLVAPTALATKAEKTETEPSATKATLITAFFEGATLTRTKIKVLVGATVVSEGVISAANTGVTASPLTFVVPAATKWQWEKVEGTVEAFKFSNTVL